MRRSASVAWAAAEAGSARSSSAMARSRFFRMVCWLLVAGVGAGLAAIDVAAVAAVVRRRQERKLDGDTVRRHVEAVAGNRAVARTVGSARARRALDKIDAVAGARVDVIRPADHAQGDVGHVVVRAPTVWPARRIGAQRRAQALLTRRRRRRHAQIEA